MAVLQHRSHAREALISAIVAAGLAGLIVGFAPPGVDMAAHSYQRTFLIDHGFAMWNNFWYAGRYSFITYSVIYYPLSALLGITVLAIAAIATAALAFTLVVWHEWGPAARFSSRTFTVIWAGVALSAAFPFALGAALALLALTFLQQERRKLFGLLVLLTLLASPLAFLFLVVVLAGGALAQRPRWTTVAIVLGVCTLELLVRRLFPSGGRFPFHLSDLWPELLFGFCGILATWRDTAARRLFGVFLALLITTLIAFVVPSELGSNVDRLKFAAIPLALLAVAARPRRIVLALPLIAVAAVWNISALASNANRAGSDPARSAVYWHGAIAYLHAHLTPSYRVEAVDTSEHWPAVYLPEAGIPIVRGWYRQDDFPENELLYDPKLSGAEYRAWLRQLGVRFVVLADAPPDYSARIEAQLVESGRSGLRMAFRDAHVRIYRLPHPTAIVTGPDDPSVLRMTSTHLTLLVHRGGHYGVSVRWSPYWHASRGCLTERRDGLLRLDVARPGKVVLAFELSLHAGLEALVGTSPRRSCGS